MGDWSSPLVHQVAVFGVVGFVILLVLALVARGVWSRAKKTAHRSAASESVLGAIGGPSTYRALQRK